MKNEQRSGGQTQPDAGTRQQGDTPTGGANPDQQEQAANGQTRQ